MPSRPQNQPNIPLSSEIDTRYNIIRSRGIDSIHRIITETTVSRFFPCRKVHYGTGVNEWIVQSNRIVGDESGVRHSCNESCASLEVLLASWVANGCNGLVADKMARDRGVEQLPLRDGGPASICWSLLLG